MQMLGETTKLGVMNGASCARHDHEPRFPSMCRWLLRD
jgi:hypothetical protein